MNPISIESTSQFVNSIAEWKVAIEEDKSQPNGVCTKKLDIFEDQTEKVSASAVALLKSPYLYYRPVSSRRISNTRGELIYLSPVLVNKDRWVCDLDLKGDKQWRERVIRDITALGFEVVECLYCDLSK